MLLNSWPVVSVDWIDHKIILVTVSPSYRSPKRDYCLPNRDLAEKRNYGLLSVYHKISVAFIHSFFYVFWYFVENGVEKEVVCGARVRDRVTGDEWDIHAKSVVNATGPFTDSVRRMADEKTPKICQASAGVHIVLPDYYR